MEIELPVPISFEWDEGNTNKNLKHNVLAVEAEQIFFNKPLILLPDIGHSTKIEKRYLALGRTNTGRRLLIAFTIREDSLRVISARDMSEKERLIYEKA
jgi:uncharacterized DUF497 family protein